MHLQMKGGIVVLNCLHQTFYDYKLEKQEKENAKKSLKKQDDPMQLSFFQLDDPTLSAIKTKLEESDLNNMTPLQAFDLLRSLKSELGL